MNFRRSKAEGRHLLLRLPVAVVEAAEAVASSVVAAVLLVLGQPSSVVAAVPNSSCRVKIEILARSNRHMSCGFCLRVHVSFMAGLSPPTQVAWRMEPRRGSKGARALFEVFWAQCDSSFDVAMCARESERITLRLYAPQTNISPLIDELSLLEVTSEIHNLASR